MTTNPTSGAADLPEALRLAAAISNLLCSNEAAARTLAAAADELVRLHAESEMRRAALLGEMQKAALAAGQATAAQAVVPAEWPTNEMIDAGRKAAASQGRLLGSGQSLWHVFRAMLAAAPAQPAAQPSRFGSPELQAMIIARCVEKDQADSLQEDAARYRFIRDVSYSDDVRSVLVHQQNAAMDRVIDAARKQGAPNDR